MELKRAEGESLKRWDALCADAVCAQERFLGELLRRGGQTEYGRRFHFSELRGVEAYQRAVPVTEYGDYEALIERQINGEENLLSGDRAVFYCISAGSTSRPKYVPVTLRDVEIHKTYQMDVVMDTIRKELAGVPEEELFGKIFETGDFFRTFMPDGTMNGVRSGVLHRYLESEGAMDYSRYTAPKEVLFPEKPENMLYVKLRFALSCRGVTAIHGVLAHGVARLFRYLQEHWDAFLTDIKTGRVSDCFRVSARWRAYLESRLAPDPDRAAELRAVPIHNADGGSARRIWPGVKYIRFAGGSVFQTCMDEIRKFTGDLPVHHYAYAASEGTLGAAYGMNREDAYYVLIPDSCFFEFLPEGAAGETPLTFREVRAGETYELIVTTPSGLYRYAIGDVVEVTGFYGKAPVIRVSHRKNQVLNIAGEKMNARQLESAAREFEALTGCALEGYCVDAGFERPAPFYRVYLEAGAGGLPDGAAGLLDGCLANNCLGYKSAREMEELGAANITALEKGSFLAYEGFLAERGYRMEQNKPLRILRTEEQKIFFRERAVQ